MDKLNEVHFKSNVDTMFGYTEMVKHIYLVFAFLFFFFHLFIRFHAENDESFLFIFILYFRPKQESYRFLVNEFRNPELLKMIDKQFEMEFPLQHTKLKFHTRVNKNKMIIQNKIAKILRIMIIVFPYNTYKGIVCWEYIFISFVLFFFFFHFYYVHTQQYSEIATEMRNYYFDDKHIDNRTLHEFSQMMSDIWFNYGIDLSARIHSNKSDGDTFFYK